MKLSSHSNDKYKVQSTECRVKAKSGSRNLVLWHSNITVGIKVGGVGETAAELVGEKYEKRRRIENFVAVCAAVSLWSAAVLAELRRV